MDFVYALWSVLLLKCKCMSIPHNYKEPQCSTLLFAKILKTPVHIVTQDAHYNYGQTVTHQQFEALHVHVHTV